MHVMETPDFIAYPDWMSASVHFLSYSFVETHVALIIVVR